MIAVILQTKSMKYFLLLFSLVALSFVGCQSDDDDNAELSWDGPNQDAPDLEAGTHIAAARFPGSLLQEFSGRSLEAVDYFIQDLPNAAELIIYGEDTPGQPGSILYQADIIVEMNSNSWNTHALTNPLGIGGEDIWISIRVDHGSTFGSVGCDPGPAESNGDWLYSFSDGEWRTLWDRTNFVTDINWNIRGQLSDE